MTERKERSKSSYQTQKKEATDTLCSLLDIKRSKATTELQITTIAIERIRELQHNSGPPDALLLRKDDEIKRLENALDEKKRHLAFLDGKIVTQREEHEKVRKLLNEERQKNRQFMARNAQYGMYHQMNKYGRQSAKGCENAEMEKQWMLQGGQHIQQKTYGNQAMYAPFLSEGQYWSHPHNSTAEYPSSYSSSYEQFPSLSGPPSVASAMPMTTNQWGMKNYHNYTAANHPLPIENIPNGVSEPTTTQNPLALSSDNNKGMEYINEFDGTLPSFEGILELKGDSVSQLEADVLKKFNEENEEFERDCEGIFVNNKQQTNMS